jgi:hypothetical protein
VEPPTNGAITDDLRALSHGERNAGFQLIVHRVGEVHQRQYDLHLDAHLRDRWTPMESNPDVLFEAAIVVCYYGPTLSRITDHEMRSIGIS